MELSDVLAQRHSVKKYNPDREVTDDELRALFALALRAPSSYNLQHWRFVVVRDKERKQRLCEFSWNQRQVAQCSAVILVLGDLKKHRQAGKIYADAPEEIQGRLIPIISGFYQGKPDLQRDEALRSGSLVSMTLMLAAKELGLDTCPMIGFDPVAVTEYLNVDENHVPVMMITLGEQAGDPPRASSRQTVGEVVHLEDFHGSTLAEG